MLRFAMERSCSTIITDSRHTPNPGEWVRWDLTNCIYLPAVAVFPFIIGVFTPNNVNNVKAIK
jgi:hypothetical protein